MAQALPSSKPPSDSSQPVALSESVWLLERFRSGDEAAATELFERFTRRLASLVQSRLSSKLARRLDAEDVVMSAYRSFFVRARAGQFAVNEAGDLWRLLAQIALNKLYRSAEWHGAARRTPDREQPDVTDLANYAVDVTSASDVAVIVTDQLEHLTSELTQATSQVLELRLQGHDVEEIATLIGRSPRTVRRQLESIRATFVRLAGDEVIGLPNLKSDVCAVTTDTLHTDTLQLNRLADRRRTLNEFVLRRQIGLGLTGRVYEAFDKRDRRLVAVKVLRKSLLADQSLRERFEAETNIVTRLNHPGIVRIHGHGETPNQGRFLVMDLLPNGELTPLAGPSLPIDQAVEWIRQVASAIAYAHQQGVIHCDLKPANLLLSAERQVVVTDFGFARLHKATAQGPRWIAGTPAFMAPEQIDGIFGEIGPQTDVFGLGSVLFYLLTGATPIEGIDDSNVFEKLASLKAIRAVTALRPDVPFRLESVCHRCLKKFPNERYQTCEDLISALSENAHF